MAKRHFLQIYVIQVRKKHSDGISFDEVADVVGKKGKTLFEIFLEFFYSLEKKPVVDSEEQTVIECDDIQKKASEDKIYGILRSGKFGSDGNLLNASTLQRKPYSSDEAPSLDHYFQVYAPKGGYKGILALHDLGGSGCKTTFENALNEFVSDKYPQLKIYFKALKLDFKKDLKKFHKRLSVRRIRRTEYKPLRTEDQLISKKKIEDRDVIIETSIHLGRAEGSLMDFGLLHDADNYKGAVKKTFSHYYSQKDSEKAKYDVTIDMDGQSQTVRVGAAIEFTMSFDITDQLDEASKRKTLTNQFYEICDKLVQHAVDRVT